MMIEANLFCFRKIGIFLYRAILILVLLSFDTIAILKRFNTALFEYVCDFI